MTVRPHPDFMKAGKIAARALSEVMSEVKPGVRVIKICALVEHKIMEYGATSPAFPCNVSINNEAAHYTSPHKDTKVFPDKGLVKIDLGANVNGYLSDTAATVDLDGSYEKYVAASEDALEAAIEVIRPDISLGQVGSVIERTIKKSGLRPVHQLTGHQLKQWDLHAGKNVPNVGMRITSRMKAGEYYAVEPFSTDGNGTVKAGKEYFIFANDMKRRKKHNKQTRQIRDFARKKFGTLPWAGRWLYRFADRFDIPAIIHTLLRSGTISGYPVLYEGKDGMVSQAEHSLFIGDEGAIVSTLRE